MAKDKSQSEAVDHDEHPRHEAELAGALALANLFSNCVEAFNLIRPQHKWDRDEQLLLARLGIQQARLLIWGDIVGISSPPKTVTDRAIPRRPSAAYPDTNEPTFFAARDARLDETATRTTVEQALSDVVDRSTHHTREEMMRQYGLAPPKRFSSEFQQALDTTRLEGFREKYELLQEVAESYAQFSTRRSQSIVQTSWVVADAGKFGRFIALTQEKVNALIDIMGVQEGVDRGMRIDIRAFGWHLTLNRSQTAQDTSKLRLIANACAVEYPQYVKATEQALEQINRERLENAYNSQVVVMASPRPAPSPAQDFPDSHHGKPELNGSTADHTKRSGGLLNRLSKSFGRHKAPPTERSQSVSSTTSEPERAQSDAGPLPTAPAPPELMTPLAPIRSKSVGAIFDVPVISFDEEILKHNLERLSTRDDAKEPLMGTSPVGSMISRHDQYHGIARTMTKDLAQ